MKQLEKIIVVGMGFVGLTLAVFLASKKLTVIGIDTDVNKLEMLKQGIVPFYEPRLDQALKNSLKKSLTFTNKLSDIDGADIVFVTVGTPPMKDGSIDLRHIKSVSEQISQWCKHSDIQPIIVYKSTILPGTFENVIRPILHSLSENVIVNPEFLREGSALQDTIDPHVVVIGGKSKPALSLQRFYQKLYSTKTPIKITTATTAELIKYANNSFLAAKISFINTIANICQRFPGTNVDDVAEIIGLDPRIGRLFLKAGPGYGGSCFPKDVQALLSLTKNLDTGSDFLNAIHKTNVDQIEIVLQLITKNVKPLKNSTISLLGLAFKEDSDDVRESVSINLIEKLLAKKVNIKVHDPKAIDNAKSIFKNKITYYSDVSNCLKNSDCAVLLTPWKQYLSLCDEFSKMRNPILIDTRRLLANKKLSVKYIGLGIGNEIVS
jgi:UDPglucose 6-dehydrogenase